jgi:SAM-dependent methyltransferase
MPQRKPIKHKRLIVDVGSGYGEFTSLLKKRNPNSKVIGIDRLEEAKARVRMSMGEFANKLKDPSRLEGIWLNHVNTTTASGFREFERLVRIVPKKTPIFLTMRKESIPRFKNSIKELEKNGLKLKSEIPFDPNKMIGSKFTHKFYEDAIKRGTKEKMPYRIVLIKE